MAAGDHKTAVEASREAVSLSSGSFRKNLGKLAQGHFLEDALGDGSPPVVCCR